MNKTFKIILLSLLAVVVAGLVYRVCTVAMLYRQNIQLARKPPAAVVIAHPRFDWSILSPKTCVELVSALRFDEMIFDNQTLAECLKQLSEKTYGILGKGFSFSIKGPEGVLGLSDSRISLRLKQTTFHEILKALGEATGATIEVTEYGVQATYGKTPEKKP
jgi:hypothetical protein